VKEIAEEGKQTVTLSLHIRTKLTGGKGGAVRSTVTPPATLFSR
jgi:hypothetical protein